MEKILQTLKIDNETRVNEVAKIVKDINTTINQKLIELKVIENHSDNISKKLNNAWNNKTNMSIILDLQDELENCYHSIVELENTIKYLEELKQEYSNEILRLGKTNFLIGELL